MPDNSQFTALAEYYDKLNGADYSAYADYIESVVKKYGRPDMPLTLELGCGTGSLTLELASRGYDMIGADISAEMLNVAMDRAYDAEKQILYLLQDMRSFELYGTVGTIVCALDGLNYLESEADVLKTMKLVRNYLEYGGVFIFDVNTPWKFRNVFAKRDFFTEDGEGEVYMGWRSEWREEEALCNFLLTLFIKNEDFCVVEMGMRAQGEIDWLSYLCEPETAVITGVGTSHIGLLGGKEAIFSAKTEILKHTKKYAVVPLPVTVKSL